MEFPVLNREKSMDSLLLAVIVLIVVIKKVNLYKMAFFYRYSRKKNI